MNTPMTRAQLRKWVDETWTECQRQAWENEMSKDEIIKLAQGTAGWNWMDEAHIQRFASALIAAEREACMRETERLAVLIAAAEREAICSIVYGHCGSDNDAQRIVDAIRARGEK